MDTSDSIWRGETAAFTTESGGCGPRVGIACLIEGETEEQGDPNTPPHVNVVKLGFRLHDC